MHLFARMVLLRDALVAMTRLPAWTLLGLVVLAAGCGRPPAFAASVGSAPRIVLYEGLPHPNAEHDDFEKERARVRPLDLHGNAFYPEPIALDDAAQAELRSALSDESLYEPFRADKKCGPFHADYGVQWERDGARYTLLLCFSCGEAAWYDAAGAESHNDLADARKARLVQILFRHGKNRPAMGTVKREKE